MINEYKCKETLYLEKCDDNGMLTDKQFAVVKGSRWQEDTECKYRICGTPDTVRLDRIAPKRKEWIEITRDMLKEYFDPVFELGEIVTIDGREFVITKVDKKNNHYLISSWVDGSKIQGKSQHKN